MPTSNGQVTARDIRQQAVRTLHLTDLNVTEPKLADLSVTVDKAAAPSFVFAGESPGFHNAALTTTAQELDSLTVNVPSWVGVIHVFGVANSQFTNSSGGNQQLNVSCRVNDEDDGARSSSVANGFVLSHDHHEAVSISIPGSTVQISNYTWMGSGTNSSNNGHVYVVVLGER